MTDLTGLYNWLVIGIMLVAVFYLLYLLGGDTIIFFRSHQKPVREDSNAAIRRELKRYTAVTGNKVLWDITLYLDGESCHYDAIIVGEFGVLLLLSCGRAGELFGGEKDETWAQRFKGNRSRFTNPLLTLPTAARLVRTALFQAGVRPKVLDAYMVFTAKGVLVNLPKTAPYLLLKNMGADIDKARYLEKNELDVAAAITALEKYRVQ